MQQLEEMYPAYDEELPQKQIAYENGFDDEIAALKSAVQGQFGAAFEIVASMPDQRQRKFTQLVLTIELFRFGRVDGALKTLADLELMELEPYDRIHLALGFAGRIPWVGYPFPDWQWKRALAIEPSASCAGRRVCR